jgi:hypothetical protein
MLIIWKKRPAFKWFVESYDTYFSYMVSSNGIPLPLLFVSCFGYTSWSKHLVNSYAKCMDILTWGPVLKPVQVSILLSLSIKTRLIQLEHFGASNNKQRYLCRKVKRAMIYLRLILSRFCLLILIFKLLCQFNFQLSSMSLGKILLRTVRSKHSMFIWQRNTVHFEAANGNHTLLFYMKFWNSWVWVKNQPITNAQVWVKTHANTIKKRIYNNCVAKLGSFLTNKKNVSKWKNDRDGQPYYWIGVCMVEFNRLPQRSKSGIILLELS